MQLPRTTIRLWMVAVFASSVMSARRGHGSVGRMHETQSITVRLSAGYCNTCGDNFPRDLDFLAIYYREVEPQRAWYARMAKMYKLAAACPWLPFDIDVAEPK